MHSRLLRSFLVVAEKGGISAAAEALHVSQPALSKSIQKLEEDLGVALFDRLSVGVRLTAYGEILLHHVKVMSNEYRHAVARIEAMRDGRAQALRLGAGPVWLVRLLPPLVAKFQARNPNVTISLVGGVIDTLVPDLIRGDLDLICTSLDFPNRSEVIKQPLFDIRHVLVADPAHPLADGTVHSAGDLHDQPWMVLKSDYVGTERILSFFAAHGLPPPHIAFETTSIHSLMQALRTSSCIAHIPEQMLPMARDTGLVQVSLRETIWETSAGYAYRAGGQVTQPIKAFMALLHEADFIRDASGQPSAAMI